MTACMNGLTFCAFACWSQYELHKRHKQLIKAKVATLNTRPQYHAGMTHKEEVAAYQSQKQMHCQNALACICKFNRGLAACMSL